MRRLNINFRRTKSDRKAERSVKSSLIRRVRLFQNLHYQLDYRFQSKFPSLHAKMTTLKDQFTSRYLSQNKTKPK